MLFYCPLEPLAERYTGQLAAAKVGWLERKWTTAGVAYTRVLGNRKSVGHINIGQVLDAVERSSFCFYQVNKLLSWAKQGRIHSNDVIYFDDFWHPGIESLAYAFHFLGISPKMYATLYAQSVDEYDFTYPMRRWMRHYEKGNGEILTGIFVACPLLKSLVVEGGIAPQEKVHVTGLIFDSEEVRSRVEWGEGEYTKRNKVVFSSRWDWEKNPKLFLEIVDLVLRKRPETEFVVCTSADTLRSNQPDLLADLDRAILKHRGGLVKKEGLWKEEYYKELAEAKIQVNTALQDFVSFTLLEASVFGCYPVYPMFRSFPETFLNHREFMYPHQDAEAAADRIFSLLARDDLWTKELVEERSWIHRRFDSTWARQLSIMGVGGEYEKHVADPFSGS